MLKPETPLLRYELVGDSAGPETNDRTLAIALETSAIDFTNLSDHVVEDGTEGARHALVFLPFELGNNQTETGFTIAGEEGYQPTFVGFQGYVSGETDGCVDLHLEPTNINGQFDTWEIYFPLTGIFTTQLQDEIDDQKFETDSHPGQFEPQQLNQSSLKLLQGPWGPVLEVETGGHTEIINPVYLPPGRKHGSRQMDNAESIFLACKFTRPVKPETT